jgi:hypothetical protein
MIKFWRLFFGVVMMALPCFILAETVNFPVEIPYPVYENVNGVVRLIDVNTDEIIDSLNVTIAPGQEEAEYSFQYTSTDNEIENKTSKPSIYPNPSTGNHSLNIKSETRNLDYNKPIKFTLLSPGKINIKQNDNLYKSINIYNIKGKKIDINSEVPSGIYIAKINPPTDKTPENRTRELEVYGQIEFNETNQTILPLTQTLYPDQTGELNFENLYTTDFNLITPDNEEVTEPVRIITTSPTGQTLTQLVTSGTPITIFRDGLSGLYPEDLIADYFSFVIADGTPESQEAGIPFLSKARNRAIGDGTDLETTLFMLHEKPTTQTLDQNMSIKAETGTSCNKTFAHNQQFMLYIPDEYLNNPDKTEQQLQNGAENYNARIAYLGELIKTYTGELPHIDVNTREVYNPENSLIRIQVYSSFDELEQPYSGNLWVEDTGYGFALAEYDGHTLELCQARFDINDHYDGNTALNGAEFGELGAHFGNPSNAVNEHQAYSKFPQGNFFESEPYPIDDVRLILRTFMGLPGAKNTQYAAKAEINGNTYIFTNLNRLYGGAPAADDQIVEFPNAEESTLIQGTYRKITD